MAIDERVLEQRSWTIEWEMFHAVQGIDGPASCQQDRKTFEIMRSSQLLGWNERDRRELSRRPHERPGAAGAIS